MAVDWRPAHKPDDVIGYEYRDEDTEVYFFWCAWHHDAEDLDDMSPITAQMAHDGYYTCDRMGCEYTWWHKTIRLIPDAQEGENTP